MVATNSTVAGWSWPRPRSVTRPRRASNGRPGSTSGPRRRGLAKASRAKLASSPATASSVPALAASPSTCSAYRVSAGLLSRTAAVLSPGGQRAGLGAQLAHRPVALPADRLAALVDDPVGLLLRLGHEIPAQPLGVGPRLVDDALRLLLGAGQPLPVLPQQLLRLLALALGLLELALDVLRPLLERLVGTRERDPP